MKLKTRVIVQFLQQFGALKFSLYEMQKRAKNVKEKITKAKSEDNLIMPEQGGHPMTYLDHIVPVFRQNGYM